jgi:hypothetical protein
LNQHHVGGRRADHGPKHAPGVISDEGRPEMGAKGRLPQSIRSSAGEISRLKGLDRDIPVTEVWSLGKLTQTVNSQKRSNIIRMRRSYAPDAKTPVIQKKVNASHLLYRQQRHTGCADPAIVHVTLLDSL